MEMVNVWMGLIHSAVTVRLDSQVVYVRLTVLVYKASIQKVRDISYVRLCVCIHVHLPVHDSVAIMRMFNRK